VVLLLGYASDSFGICVSIGISHRYTDAQFMNLPRLNNTILISTPPVVALSKDEFAPAALDPSVRQSRSTPNKFGLGTIHPALTEAPGNIFRLILKSNPRNHNHSFGHHLASIARNLIGFALALG
jgi:hypothetical protein